MSELNDKLLNGGRADGEIGDMADTKAAAFETVNGESIAVFYNPLCSSDTLSGHYAQNKMCVNFVYDLNGNEGPNQIGKDVGFITAFYNKNPVVVAPIIYNTNYTSTAPLYTQTQDKIDAQTICKSPGEDLRLPDRDELASLFVNAPFINMNENNSGFWSSTIISSGATISGWRQGFNNGHRHYYGRSALFYVLCIKR